MKLTSLRANHFDTPLGCDLTGLSLSWIPASDKAKKAVWSRVRIAADPDFKTVLHDSGQAPLDSLAYAPGLALAPRTRYFWRVDVLADNGETASADSWFETGKMAEPWEAKWVARDLAKGKRGSTGHFRLRGAFTLPKGADPAAVRAYVGVLGVFEIFVNGVRATDEVLLPGYHDYLNHVQTMTFDLAPFLKPGRNEIELHVGKGWYRSKMAGWEKNIPTYGDQTAAICEVRAGAKLLAKTDETWTSAPSPVLESEIYYGEDVDARIAAAPAKWTPVAIVAKFPRRDPRKAAFDDRALRVGPLADRFSPPIRVTEILEKPDVIRTPKGEVVLDFRQEMTGWVEVKNRAPAGATWSLEAGEILDANGNFFRDNLRGARAKFVYTSAGEIGKAVRPHFTFFGFRYVRLTGIENPDPKDFRGLVIHSDLERTGNVETGNAKLNRFFLNTVWGQRGNFLDVPTDCPQRDERLGWTGDIQAFSGTASFHYDCAAFFNKYVWDMIGLQKDNLGSVPFTVPEPVQWWVDRRSHGSAAWGDAATVVPWTAYVRSGDKALLRRMYPAMKMWVDYIRTRDDTHDGGKRLWLKDWHFADWLALDNHKDPLSSLGATDHFYVASAYYARSTELTLRAAEVLGLYADAEELRALLAEIKAAIRAEYFSPNGRCVVDTQTAYAVALWFDLVPKAWRKRCADILAKKIEDNKWALDTGFVGTHMLCLVLGSTGHADIAYKLLLREAYPSWIYEVDSGATTVWERWNGQGPASRPEFLGMNSFNHYAYGAVAEWMYRGVCGLEPDEAAPGFRHVFLRPVPCADLGRAKAVYDSPCGRWESGWEMVRAAGANRSKVHKLEGSQVSDQPSGEPRFRYRFRVPFGCTATLELPGQAPRELGPGLHAVTA